MRTWARATHDRRCGGCGGHIRIGAPFIEITIEGIRAAMRRCATCAGGPVPPDLPARIVERAPAPAETFSRIVAIWRERGGTREPGQEG